MIIVLILIEIIAIHSYQLIYEGVPLGHSFPNLRLGMFMNKQIFEVAVFSAIQHSMLPEKFNEGVMKLRLHIISAMLLLLICQTKEYLLSG